MFDEFETTHKAHIPEPELVPILDALTAVIFFLLLSVTFMELTKITVPPSQSSVVTDPVVPPPRSPKMFVKVTGPQDITLTLQWAGDKPDMIRKTVARSPDNARSQELQDTVNDIVMKYKAKFSDEKSLQMAFSENITYQELISAMDGARKEMSDLVLLSPEDAKLVSDKKE